jgi:transposase
MIVEDQLDIGGKEMLEMANIEFIRKQFYVKGKSIRQISLDTGYARQTVRKALNTTEVPKYKRTNPVRKPVIDSVKEIILTWLKEDESAPPKQRHSARRIYQRLVDEFQFSGGESTIRRYVRQLKKATLSPEGFVPLEYHLKRLKFPTVKNQLDIFIREAEERQLSYSEFLCALLEQEVQERDVKQIDQRI